MNASFKLKSIILLVGILTLQVPVSYADSFLKYYHSSECTPVGTEIKGYQYSNMIRNRTSATITVICPIIRTIPQSTSGFYALQARVHVDNVSGKSYTCTLSLYDNDGRYATSNVATSSGDSVYTYLKNSATKFNEGAYNLTCKIPPGGGLYNYRVDEYL